MSEIVAAEKFSVEASELDGAGHVFSNLYYEHRYWDFVGKMVDSEGETLGWKFVSRFDDATLTVFND